MERILIVQSTVSPQCQPLTKTTEEIVQEEIDALFFESVRQLDIDVKWDKGGAPDIYIEHGCFGIDELKKIIQGVERQRQDTHKLSSKAKAGHPQTFIHKTNFVLSSMASKTT